MNQIQSFSTIEGPSGVGVDDVAHLIIPGLYRSSDGTGLHEFSEQRVVTASEFYKGQVLVEKSGLIICSGYKNPADQYGEPWWDEDGKEYQGVPEAVGMRHSLIDNHGIPASAIRTEVESIDTVTNFTNSQELLPDDRPVGIVAQEQHLDRIMKIIAPKTMRNDYLGIVVPELSDMVADESALKNTLIRLASHYIVRGLTPNTPHSSEIAATRAMLAWKLNFVLSDAKNLLLRSSAQKPAHSR
ncbi:MAG TPA: ElyC/SanA/YdcF family protein [Candidatus Saccharimonadales bacterium]|nr:ElyC/SanA/YdcF family protein [Candidatus Saccharimonadales bacterium]